MALGKDRVVDLLAVVSSALEFVSRDDVRYPSQYVECLIPIS